MEEATGGKVEGGNFKRSLKEEGKNVEWRKGEVERC